MRVRVAGNGHLADVLKELCWEFGHIDADPLDILWIAYDTPVHDGHGDVEWVLAATLNDIATTSNCPLVLVSSQLPIGSIARLESLVPHFTFAYAPENIRSTDGPEAYKAQDRIICGVRKEDSIPILRDLFSFAKSVQFMTVESAEMVKHAVNAYLGMCIAFANEIAALCRHTSADPREVERGLLTEGRVSPRAPLKSGAAFSGGHLDRDLHYLKSIADEHNFPIDLIRSIQSSNDRHAAATAATRTRCFESKDALPSTREAAKCLAASTSDKSTLPEFQSMTAGAAEATNSAYSTPTSRSAFHYSETWDHS